MTVFLPALDFTTDFCCDNHNNGFDLTKYFPGSITPLPKLPSEKKKQSKYCPMDQRAGVASQLTTWRKLPTPMILCFRVGLKTGLFLMPLLFYSHVQNLEISQG
jgi:hypothetical protein